MKSMTKLGIGLLLATLATGAIWLTIDQYEKGKEKNSLVAFEDLMQNVQMCTPKPIFVTEPGDPGKPIAPLLEGLGDYHYKVTTDVERAQTFFDQGLRLVYAFNHSEAHRAFREAARLDPECAMAYWGQALALGPNINDPIPDEEREMNAFKAISKAQSLKAGVSQKERDLIDALAARYTSGTADRAALNSAYADKMAALAAKYSEDPEAKTFYAAALMNTMPWNYWTDDWQPQPGTETLLKQLKEVIDLYPKHPGAHHYYIHATELPHPDWGEPSAEALEGLMPSAGHLVHMPSHIYLRVGRYGDASRVNELAILADEDYIAQCQAQGMYPLAYYPHNIHFLWSAASMEGRSNIAIDAAEKVADRIPVSEMGELHFLQDFYATPLFAYVRFGKWNDILTTHHPGEGMVHAEIMWHYARGIAFARKGLMEKAHMELEALESKMQNPELADIVAAFNNSTDKVGMVALNLLRGEVAAAEGKWDEAITHLTNAVQNQDDLVYTEPPAWHSPTRHTLGAVLLDADRPVQAEAVYRKDLEQHPRNGWALYGLHQSLIMQGKTKEAKDVLKTFHKTWENSDVQLTASRF